MDALADIQGAGKGIGAGIGGGDDGKIIGYLVVSPRIGGINPVTGDGFGFGERGRAPRSPIEVNDGFGGAAGGKGELAGIEVQDGGGGKVGGASFFSLDKTGIRIGTAGELTISEIVQELTGSCRITVREPGTFNAAIEGGGAGYGELAGIEVQDGGGVNVGGPSCFSLDKTGIRIGTAGELTRSEIVQELTGSCRITVREPGTFSAAIEGGGASYGKGG